MGTSFKLGVHFMPEFLTEKNWEQDFRTNKEWILGVDACKSDTRPTGIDDRKDSGSTLDAQTDIHENAHALIVEQFTSAIRNAHHSGRIESKDITIIGTKEAEMVK
eukprot:CAMPEP_0116929312 /NCGR_PEP_ID=MMETSP0467-20121206/26506_1 /TAXON_ID=283647 /ORGANISM="Mesodinium pulex, Strain SPMC105" /LENGTH=105 /DNA_ID=CAMNT_0004609257 /DNA_START=282 /DNA_END=599 /DNA_ORIENTATION=-